MEIVSMVRVREAGEITRMEVEFKMDKDELDLIVWAMEAFVAKSGGQPIHRFALGVVDDLKSAYKTVEK